MRADLSNVSFLHANLYKADFSNANITDMQLDSALSIQNALLTDREPAQDKNLISNGQADCNIALVDNWILQTGNITTMISDKDVSKCHFVLQSYNMGATMLQRTGLPNWDPNVWSYTQAVLSASMSIGVSIQLTGISSTRRIHAQQKLSKCQHTSTDFITSFVYRFDCRQYQPGFRW
jgi:uncharacterized protein YjbI with pentapeptide repeats